MGFCRYIIGSKMIIGRSTYTGVTSSIRLKDHRVRKPRKPQTDEDDSSCQQQGTMTSNQVTSPPAEVLDFSIVTSCSCQMRHIKPAWTNCTPKELPVFRDPTGLHAFSNPRGHDSLR
ncbi:hypothetical protein PHMEG_00011479 [Phytophthora megakarya]|uniref:Uncharacterized protein n=1 Tax=Phytophthora megakarya TaxID=4795 RepID=A0A225WBL7_9STRA|nr:hypothetical protein PHMEG_00011479 [Phytophthora megakarya]